MCQGLCPTFSVNSHIQHLPTPTPCDGHCHYPRSALVKAGVEDYTGSKWQVGESSGKLQRSRSLCFLMVAVTEATQSKRPDTLETDTFLAVKFQIHTGCLQSGWHFGLPHRISVQVRLLARGDSRLIWIEKRRSEKAPRAKRGREPPCPPIRRSVTWSSGAQVHYRARRPGPTRRPGLYDPGPGGEGVGQEGNAEGRGRARRGRAEEGCSGGARWGRGPGPDSHSPPSSPPGPGAAVCPTPASAAHVSSRGSASSQGPRG